MTVVSGTSTLTIILGVATLGLFALSMYLMNRQTKLNQHASLVSIMIECGSKPLGIIVDRAGTMLPFISEPNEKNKGLIDNEFTIVNPDLVKSNTKRASRLRLKNGPEVVIYPLPYYFPFDIHSSAALCQLARKIRKHPDFGWIGNERRVLELLFNVTDTFEADCRMLVTSSIAMHNVVPKAFLEMPEEEEEEEEELEEVEEFGEEEQANESIAAFVGTELEEEEETETVEEPAEEKKTKSESLLDKLRHRK